MDQMEIKKKKTLKYKCISNLCINDTVNFGKQKTRIR